MVVRCMYIHNAFKHESAVGDGQDAHKHDITTGSFFYPWEVSYS